MLNNLEKKCDGSSSFGSGGAGGALGVAGSQSGAATIEFGGGCGPGGQNAAGGAGSNGVVYINY